MGEAAKSASQPPEQGLGLQQQQQPPREAKAPAAAPTRIEVTIPIPLDMYQGSGAARGSSSELWDQGGREGAGTEPELGRGLTEAVAGAGGTGDRKEGPSPLCARAPLKEDSSGRERDEDRDVDETSAQGLPALAGQPVPLAPEKGSWPAAAQETREEQDGEKPKGALRDTPGEALLVEAESREAGEDQEEKKRQLPGGEGGPDITLSEPSGSVSQKEAEPKEGGDSGPVLEAARLPAEAGDDVKDKAAPSEEVPDAGGRRTPRRKAADKGSSSRVPLLKGVCSSCCLTQHCSLRPPRLLLLLGNGLELCCDRSLPALPLYLILDWIGWDCQTLALRFRVPCMVLASP